MNQQVESSCDYRQSHLKKGVDYDSHNVAVDFNTCMEHREVELLRRIVHGLLHLEILLTLPAVGSFCPDARIVAKRT